jgi:hypothetical protein
MLMFLNFTQMDAGPIAAYSGIRVKLALKPLVTQKRPMEIPKVAIPIFNCPEFPLVVIEPFVIPALLADGDFTMVDLGNFGHCFEDEKPDMCLEPPIHFFDKRNLPSRIHPGLCPFTEELS